jgi:hypothetical protein
MKIKYGGKRGNMDTGEWELTTPIIMNDADYIAHEQAEECYLCRKVFRCLPSCHACEKCLGLG